MADTLKLLTPAENDAQLVHAAAAMFGFHLELAQLEENITETQRIISRQVAWIEQGTDTEKAKAVLHGLKQVLNYFYARRERILDVLTRQ